MKSLLVLCAVVALASAAYEVLDQIDTEAVVSDRETMKAFVGCFLDRSICNELTGAFDDVHVELLDTRCARCSDKLKYSVRRFYEELPKLHPDKWAQYRDKFGGERVDGLFSAVRPF